MNPAKWPLVLSIPHGSSRVPEDILATMALKDGEIADSVDLGVEELLGVLPFRAVVRAPWSRLVADPNRDPRRRDIRGVIAARDYYGRSIFLSGQFPEERVILERVQTFHAPFHKALCHALDDDCVRGLIDGHSLNGYGPSGAPDAGVRRKDLVLGNNGDHEGRAIRGGEPLTCPPALFHAMKEAFEARGFSVALNDPYSGGFICTHYADMHRARDLFAVQMELNQDLVVDSVQKVLIPERVSDVRQEMAGALEQIAGLLS